MSDTNWEAIGREAVAAGMPAWDDLAWMIPGESITGRTDERWLSAGWSNQSGEHVPDFRVRLTASACGLWVEDVALEVYGDTAVVETIRVVGSGVTRVVVRLADMMMVVETGATLPESAIAAVTAMRGGATSG